MRQWYVVYSKPRQERFAQRNLRRKGVEVFLPQLRLPRYVRQHERVVPLFPSYLFVRIAIPEQYHTVLWSPGVKRFVNSATGPTPLDDSVVSFLMGQGTDEGLIAARADLKVGQQVQIKGGHFAGLIAVIQEAPDGKGRVKVLMELLRRQVVKVDVPVQTVATTWVV